MWDCAVAQVKVAARLKWSFIRADCVGTYGVPGSACDDDGVVLALVVQICLAGFFSLVVGVGKADAM